MPSKIKSIHFVGNDTVIGHVESYQPKDGSEVANEKAPGIKYDLPRHGDFTRAMDKLKPHLVIAPGFADPLDAVGNIYKKQDFDDFFADSDEAPLVFKGLEVTGIIIQGKNTADGVQICGFKINYNGDVVKFKTGPIALKRVQEGYNYPLLDILDEQIDKLLSEADKFKSRKKHGAGVQKEMELVA